MLENRPRDLLRFAVVAGVNFSHPAFEFRILVYELGGEVELRQRRRPAQDGRPFGRKPEGCGEPFRKADEAAYFVSHAPEAFVKDDALKVRKVRLRRAPEVAFVEKAGVRKARADHTFKPPTHDVLPAAGTVAHGDEVRGEAAA